MPVTSVTTDHDNLTLTICAEFAAPLARVWQLYADPRQLEKVWGPPTHPATFIEHSLTPGGRMVYYMTGPEGEKYAGWWEVLSVDEPSGFTFNDGFADQDFHPVPDLPVSHNAFSFSETDGVTHASFVSTYASAEALQTVLDMGMIDGATASINQIDALVAP